MTHSHTILTQCRQRCIPLLGVLVALVGTASAQDSGNDRTNFETRIQPILAEFCYGCHADGAEEGSLSFDSLLELKDEHDVDEQDVKETWHRVLKQLRADLMPPQDEDQPSGEQIKTLETWIVQDALGLDIEKPPPGRVTVRRLNRVEYRNTIRDLLGVDYNTSVNFPADNTGHGFDNIADVLSISPLLLEKYFDSANEIVSSTVPITSGTEREQWIAGSQFKIDPKQDATEDDEADKANGSAQQRGRFGGFRRPREDHFEASYYEAATGRATTHIEHAGDYRLRVKLEAVEDYVDNVFDLNRCELTLSLDSEELLKEEFVRQGGKDYTFEFERTLTAGEHEFVVSVRPLSEEEQVRKLRIRLHFVAIIGPLDERFYVKPNRYAHFFPREVAAGAAERKEYARELLAPFAKRAFRRPVDDDTIDRLVSLVESVYEGGQSFEAGIAKGMTAILASPRFIFREEFADDSDTSQTPYIDQYALASRLSYFLWSSMPDDELFRLAGDGKLRENLDRQVKRMLADEKSKEFVANFAGQWLRTRDIETIQISARSVLRRETPPDPKADERRRRFFELFRKGDDRTEEEEKELEEARAAFRASFNRGPRIDLTRDVRRAMRQETEMLFEHIIQNDRNLLELVDADYTFLNKTLAKFYEIENDEDIEDEMQLVELSKDSVRGGVLTQGTFLAVTSNPDRTSPVKRGLFILENLLGMPTAAPPPNVPALEDVDGPEGGKPLSLRETLAVHREDALCTSCHNRMDPLGLALENFNALGRYRDQELGKPIESAGRLITGERFSTIQELKQILVTSRKREIYRCMTEKMLTYAVGRAVEIGDIPTVDRIVDELDTCHARSSVLLNGIIHSPAFQRTTR